MFSLALVLFAAVFIVQLLLCFRKSPLWVRLIPAGLIALGELACVGAYAVSMHLERTGAEIYGAAFAAVVYGMMLLILLAGDGLAWLIWGIYRSVQKRRKKCVM